MSFPASSPRFGLFSLGLWLALGGAGCGEETSEPAGAGGSGASSTTASTSTSATSGTTATSGSAATSSTTTSTGSGDPLDLSECQGDTDCPDGATCVDVNAGFKLCKHPVLEATQCADPADECCNTTECGTGKKCVAGPPTAHCGGAQPRMNNVCVADECATQADCPGAALCMPAGTVGNAMNVCVPAACTGTFCGQESLSPCALLRDPCCQSVPIGFYCVSECIQNADCPGGYCELSPADGGPKCQSGSAPCPP